MNKRVLIAELTEVLELPIKRYSGEAARILDAVLQSMTEAFRRGETVKISGLGIFTVRTRKATRRGCYFFPYLGKGQHVEPCVIPEKKYVFFQPSKTITRVLNGDQRCE